MHTDKQHRYVHSLIIIKFSRHRNNCKFNFVITTKQVLFKFCADHLKFKVIELGNVMITQAISVGANGALEN